MATAKHPGGPHNLCALHISMEVLEIQIRTLITHDSLNLSCDSEIVLLVCMRLPALANVCMCTSTYPNQVHAGLGTKARAEVQLTDIAARIQSKRAICTEAGELNNALQREQMAALHRVRCLQSWVVP